MGLRALLQRSNASSATLFVAPMMLCGLTALSVETITKVRVPCALAIFASWFVPKALFRTAAIGFRSISGTCLQAAA